MTPSYRSLAEEPPERRNPNANMPLRNNLLLAAKDPGQWRRVVAYDLRNTADVTIYQLRTNRRFKSRPHGTWEFRVAQVTRGADKGKFGIWAKFTPPEATEPS